MKHSINWETGKCWNCGKKLKPLDAFQECKPKKTNPTQRTEG